MIYDPLLFAQLESLAQDCILRSANSIQPRRVLSQHFEKAYKLGYLAGKQLGLTQSVVALDILAGDQEE